MIINKGLLLLLLDSKKCSVPPDIWGSNRKLIRGIVGADSAVHGTMVEYRCRPGYRNVVAPCVAHTLTCSRGEWRGTSPQCEEFKTCIPPPNIANGFIYEVASSYPLKSQVIALSKILFLGFFKVKIKINWFNQQIIRKKYCMHILNGKFQKSF